MQKRFIHSLFFSKLTCYLLGPGLTLKFKPLIICYLCFSLSGFFSISSAYAFAQPNVWDVLRKQFSLNHQTHQPEVKKQLRWLIAHPDYLKRLAKSEPYIYHIVSEVKKHKLPGEVALIPLIESAYDPFAYSGAGAAGLWQLMPKTGQYLGLKQDWWFDGRRSVHHSTTAALKYLTRLNRLFYGNWLLAFAAYDSGEGTIGRSIKKSGQQRNKANFWSLSVPKETKAYIPRLLALAELVQNPQRYHIKLPPIPHAPYFEEVNVGSPIDLNHAAKLAGISYMELIELNPGYNRWATPPYQPYKLLLPKNKVRAFNRNLENLPKEKRVNWIRHQVSSADSLILIAKRYHTTVNILKELNQLKSDTIKKGQYILVPQRKIASESMTSPVPNSNMKKHLAHLRQHKVAHIVQRKDTYERLEARYGVTEQEIRQWNMLSPNMPLRKGQQLVIWQRNKHANASSYMIKKGDTLSGIAKRHNKKINTLLAMNPGLKKDQIRIGQSICLA